MFLIICVILNILNVYWQNDKYFLFLDTPAECEWSTWGECDATCLQNGSIPETVAGRKKRFVTTHGTNCSGEADQACTKECPGKPSRF